VAQAVGFLSFEEDVLPEARLPRGRQVVEKVIVGPGGSQKYQKYIPKHYKTGV
jgi:hypothetical protein